MSGVSQARPRGTGLTGWLRGVGGGPDAAGPAETARTLARRRLFEDVGDFLFAHDLDLTPENFRIARDQLSGDPATNRAIAGLLREHGRLTDALLAQIGADRATGIKPEVISDVAGELAERLAEVLRIVAHSHVSARDYGEALELHARTIADDPIGALDSLIPLTRDVVEATRAMEGRLEVFRRETDKLRVKVDAARREADRDHLTGLPNRRWFDARLTTLAGGAGAIVAICDIDDFKGVNDRHGHDAGDRVLKFVGTMLQRALAGRATVARYGGEEFVCLFDQDDVADAYDLLDGVRSQLGYRALVNQDSGAPIGTLTFSAGLAVVDTDGRAALRAADRALYEAKRLGKDRVVAA